MCRAVPFPVELESVLDLVAWAFLSRDVAPDDDALLLVSLVVVDPHVLARCAYWFVVRSNGLTAIDQERLYLFVHARGLRVPYGHVLDGVEAQSTVIRKNCRLDAYFVSFTIVVDTPYDLSRLDAPLVRFWWWWLWYHSRAVDYGFHYPERRHRSRVFGDSSCRRH